MTLYQLLQKDARVEFDSGFILKGNKEDEIIEMYTILAGEVHSAGWHNLTKVGVTRALKDANQHEERMKNDL